MITKEVNNDDNLAYLIVAKEASLPCDGTSKWCASRCRSHTCTKITSNVVKSLHKSILICPQIPAQIHFLKYLQQLLVNILISTTLEAPISVRYDSGIPHMIVEHKRSQVIPKTSSILPSPGYPPQPSLTSPHSSISPKIAQYRKAWNLL